MPRIGPSSTGLRIGERGLLVGIVACGEIRREGVHLFTARDRRWHPLGEFRTERAATAAIVQANRRADEHEAARVVAARRPPVPKAAQPRRRRTRRAFVRRLPIGETLRLASPIYSGEVRHDGRRRYVATNVAGQTAGVFTSLRRALDAIGRMTDDR